MNATDSFFTQTVQPHPLTDDEREAHITSCGKLMMEFHQQWELHGNFADKGEADYWQQVQKEAIQSRSPEQIARMEAARGLV